MTVSPSQRVRVTELRSRFQDGSWVALPLLVLYEGPFSGTSEVFGERVTRRTEQGFRMKSDMGFKAPGFFLFSGTDTKGNKSEILFSIVEEEGTSPEGMAWLKSLPSLEENPDTAVDHFAQAACDDRCSNPDHTHKGLVPENRSGNIREAALAGDTRQRAKRGQREASGTTYGPKIDGYRPENDHTATAEKVAPVGAPDSGIGPSSFDERLASLIDGTYTVVFQDRPHRTLKVKTSDNKEFFFGDKVLSYLSGSDNENDYTSFGALKADSGKLILWKKFRGGDFETSIREAVAVLLRDPREAGLAYAIESGRCYRCGRTLTVPASVNQGLGPECLKKAGF